jgi:Pentapeptide repeats (8 copies)
MNRWGPPASPDQQQSIPSSSWGKLSAPEWFRLLLEALGVLAVVAAVIGLWSDFRARDEDRVHRAWQLVADRTGIRTALEFLHSRGEDLSGLKLNSAYLGGAELSGAELEGIDLGRARLSGADLRKADLEGADLEGADLRGADLREANLAGAQPAFTDLRGANLAGAQLVI